MADLKDKKNWRDCVCAIIDEKVSNLLAFSSGEIVKEIREQRKDIFFKVADIGQYLRDLFYHGTIRDPQGQWYIQYPRVTQGKFRTPPGTEVFVYASNVYSALSHDFEVNIPDFNKKTVDKSYVAYGSDPNDDVDDVRGLVANVHADGRICVPRSAFDSLMHASGNRINPGDDVFVEHDSNNRVIYIRTNKREILNNANAKRYDLTRDRGRLKFKPLAHESFFVPQNSYNISIVGSGMRINY